MSKLREKLTKKAKISVSYHEFNKMMEKLNPDSYEEEKYINGENNTMVVEINAKYNKESIEKQLNTTLSNDEWYSLCDEYKRENYYDSLDAFKSMYGNTSAQIMPIQTGWDNDLLSDLGLDLLDIEENGQNVEIIDAKSESDYTNTFVDILLTLTIGIV